MTVREGSLAGKVALVTGGARRIGRKIALRLAREGAAVAVNARTSREEVEAVVAAIKASGGSAMAALADITDPAANAAMVDAVVRTLGRLDIVVHNAVAREHAQLADLDLARAGAQHSRSCSTARFSPPSTPHRILNGLAAPSS